VIALLLSTAAEVLEEEAHSDPVSDGKHILYGMLITGLIFLGVIAIGEYTRWAGDRRAAKKRAARGAY
jgi:hypothetical protein